MEAGGNYYVTVIVDDYDMDKLKYTWNLSNNLEFKGQGKPYISFITPKELWEEKIEVNLEIEGLPVNCKNKVSDSFEIQFNPGTPIVLEDYEDLSFSKEKVKLDEAIARMKEYEIKNGIITFILYYSQNDTKQTLRNRIMKIQNYLQEYHNITQENTIFIFGGVDKIKTRIYFLPPESGFGGLNWKKDLENLKIPPK